MSKGYVLAFYLPSSETMYVCLHTENKMQKGMEYGGPGRATDPSGSPGLIDDALDFNCLSKIPATPDLAMIGQDADDLPDPFPLLLDHVMYTCRILKVYHMLLY